MPQEVFQNMEMRLLKYPENVLLIRDEYFSAFKTMVSWSKNFRGGAVITGQSGIGMWPSLAEVVLVC